MNTVEDIFIEVFGKPVFSPETPAIHLVNNFNLDPGKKLILLVFGPSGAGKDTVLEPLLKMGKLVHVVTATSRRRRFNFPESVNASERDSLLTELARVKDEEYLDLLDALAAKGIVIAEPRGAYVWMPEYSQVKYGSPEEYIGTLVLTYDLVENNFHHGNLYGLPRASIKQAATCRGVPVIRTDNNGVRVLLEQLKGVYNCVALAVLPDSFEDVVSRIKGRTQLLGSENVTQRILDSHNWVEEIPQLAHLVLHNSKNELNAKSGLKRSIQSIAKLIDLLTAHVKVR